MLDKYQSYRTPAAIIFSIGTALLISFAYFQLLPNHLNPTILTEPVLFRKGYLPFNNIADQKPPLLQYLIAWTLPIFNGDGVLAVRSLHSILVFIVVLITLLWAYRLKGGWALTATGLFFLAWSFAFGYWAILYYDFVLTPFYLLALYFLTRPNYRNNIWPSLFFGLITGVAILIKQQAAMLGVLMALSLLGLGIYQKVPLKKLSSLAIGYLLGVSLPITIFVIFFVNSGGNLKEFIYWTITINLTGNYNSLARQIPDRKTLLYCLPSLILLPPFLWSILHKPTNDVSSNSLRFWLLLVFLSAIIFIYPRWSPRHLATALPFLAMISGLALADLVRLPLKKARDWVLLIFCFGVLVWWGSVAVNTYYPSIKSYNPNRFDAYSNFIDLAEDIAEGIPAEGDIVFVPTDDGTMNLYYLLDRRPPSFMFFNYPWYMEEPVIQRWLEAMEEDQPAAVIYFSGRLGIEQYAPEMIKYLYDHYKVDKEVIWENKPVLMMTLLP